jgi:AraC-like DNA-binding protein
MLLAAERLAADDEPVATIASALGYESESSFGKAFRRIIGEAPRRFARGPARSAL